MSNEISASTNPRWMPSPEGDAAFLRRAIELACENVSSGKGGPFGAVVVLDGKIVGEGANSVTAMPDPTAHAEVNAIRAAAKALHRFSLAGCVLYTSCEPCPMCMAAAYWARVDAVVYGSTAADAAAAGFDDAFLYAELAKPIAGREMPMENLLGPEAQAAFEAWRAAANKTPY